eukprot:UN09347
MAKLYKILQSVMFPLLQILRYVFVKKMDVSTSSCVQWKFKPCNITSSKDSFCNKNLAHMKETKLSSLSQFGCLRVWHHLDD